tara:strand:+ start:326 stop:652 length:327 start_codon:yes stop_codon:yes gene_type:complete
MTKITTKIATTCEDIKTLLLEKNAKYGNSAVEPISIFSKLDNAAAICARIDDKLSRIANSGLNDATEDTLNDLIGYLILLKIARERPSRAQEAQDVNVFTSAEDAAWQ